MKPLDLPQPDINDIPTGLAIVTRFHAMTDHRDARIIATCKRDNETTFRAVVDHDPRLTGAAAHYVAALAVLKKIELQNDFFSFTIQAVGCTADCYIFIADTHPKAGK
jgi:hypothetical protein